MYSTIAGQGKPASVSRKVTAQGCDHGDIVRLGGLSHMLLQLLQYDLHQGGSALQAGFRMEDPEEFIL